MHSFYILSLNYLYLSVFDGEVSQLKASLSMLR